MVSGETGGRWKHPTGLAYRIGGRVEIADSQGRPYIRATVLAVNSLNQPYVVFDPPASQVPRFLWDERVVLIGGE